MAEGLYPGMLGRVLEVSGQKIRLWVDGEEHVLSPLVAANLSVVELKEGRDQDESAGYRRLSSLEPGEMAKVKKISRACRGRQRRRFLDLGILPGTTIETAFVSGGGDPKAYRIRGALIALRKEQADTILIEAQKEAG